MHITALLYRFVPGLLQVMRFDILFYCLGFSTAACENEVMIGDYKCVPSVNQVKKIVCSLSVADEPAVGYVYPITVSTSRRQLQSDLCVSDSIYTASLNCLCWLVGLE